ncbi:hypothetical protein AC578_7004 [Pseudocercospora eumusae]|uniref:BTB domain-containing protein n=1 Tax=Pseudocercospora eumusae TaxID=321146 RepID=A0A139HCL8_9PEZI|nr:hypothetical protein AC578_7004 [Pseudocercospora eumusae]
MSTAQTEGPRPLPAPRRVVIARDGDAILRVRDVELRVDSRRLRMHSAEFGRFFDRSGNAHGLQGASAAEPYSMLLSDTSPEITALICRVLHDENTGAVNFRNVAVFNEFCLIAAKYECVAKAKAAAEGWISSFDYKAPSNDRAENLFCLIRGAWNLEHNNYFRELTRYWMENRREIGSVGAHLGILTAVDMAIGAVMGPGARSQTHIQQAINDFINTICEYEVNTEEHGEIRVSDRAGERGFQCTYSRDVREFCFEQLKEAGIWPRNQQSNDPDELCEAIRSFNPFIDLPEDLVPCDHYLCRRTIQAEINAAVRDMCRAAEPRYPGLCLQCCRLGRRYECRC